MNIYIYIYTVYFFYSVMTSKLLKGGVSKPFLISYNILQNISHKQVFVHLKCPEIFLYSPELALSLVTMASSS